jgi:hypothetical protein
MTELETHVGTQGEAPEEVGFRNQLRARWRTLPQEQRWAITIVVQLAIAFALWGLALSLTYAALFVFALSWLRKVPPLPWRLAMEAVLVIVFAIFGPRSLAILLAIVFALLWAPRRYRTWLLPVAALLTAIFYPFFANEMFTNPVFGARPALPLVRVKAMILARAASTPQASAASSSSRIARRKRPRRERMRRFIATRQRARRPRPV